jgi:hypothetical protein
MAGVGDLDVAEIAALPLIRVVEQGRKMFGRSTVWTTRS